MLRKWGKGAGTAKQQCSSVPHALQATPRGAVCARPQSVCAASAHPPTYPPNPAPLQATPAARFAHDRNLRRRESNPGYEVGQQLITCRWARLALCVLHASGSWV